MVMRRTQVSALSTRSRMLTTACHFCYTLPHEHRARRRLLPHVERQQRRRRQGQPVAPASRRAALRGRSRYRACRRVLRRRRIRCRPDREPPRLHVADEPDRGQRCAARVGRGRQPLRPRTHDARTRYPRAQRPRRYRRCRQRREPEPVGRSGEGDDAANRRCLRAVREGTAGAEVEGGAGPQACRDWSLRWIAPGASGCGRGGEMPVGNWPVASGCSGPASRRWSPVTVRQAVRRGEREAYAGEDRLSTVPSATSFGARTETPPLREPTWKAPSATPRRAAHRRWRRRSSLSLSRGIAYPSMRFSIISVRLSSRVSSRWLIRIASALTVPKLPFTSSSCRLMYSKSRLSKEMSSLSLDTVCVSRR